MKLSLIAHPFDLGHENTEKGAGPPLYLKAGAESSLTAHGFEVEVVPVRPSKPYEGELNAVADANSRLASRVREAIEEGSFPLVLGGGCEGALGTVAALGGNTGVVWFDAHGDFNTPDTSPSGYLGGMPLAVATGRCYEELWEGSGGGEPVPDSRVVMVGVRDLDPEERVQLEGSEVTVVEAANINEAGAESLKGPLSDLGSRVDGVYLHLDLDVLDPAHAPGVDYPAPGGLSVEAVEDAIRAVTRGVSVRAAAITAYNPEKEAGDATLRVGMRLMEVVARAVAARDKG